MGLRKRNNKNRNRWINRLSKKFTLTRILNEKDLSEKKAAKVKKDLAFIQKEIIELEKVIREEQDDKNKR